MKTANWFLGVLILCGSHAVTAGEVGIGKEGPNAASTNPEDSESSSDNYWQELLQWFESDEDE